MDFRSVGKSGLEVSVVGLGGNNFGGRIDYEASKAVVHRALDLGVTFIDTADIYGNGGGSEEVLGRALGARRKDVVLATKSGMQMPGDTRLRRLSRRNLIASVEASLKRLNTDWIDLYQLHEPDSGTPIEESLHAVDNMIRAGKIRYAGYSNFAAWQVVEAEWVGRVQGTSPFVSSQDEYSLLSRGHEEALFPVLKSYGLGLFPYLPLASGLLTGKYPSRDKMPAGTRLSIPNDYFGRVLTEQNFARVDALRTFVQARGKTLLELAFSWLAAMPQVSSIIAGATRPEQIDANVKAVGWNLTEAEHAEIEKITA